MSQQVLTFAGSPLSGAAMITALESRLQSLASNRSGTSRPSDIQTGEIWLDTTSATAQLLKFWDGANDITLATINATTNAVAFTGTATSGANSNITSLSGLTTPLSVAQGGTGGNTASAALTALGLKSAALLDATALAQIGVVNAYTRQQYAVPVILTDQNGNVQLDAELHQDVDVTATGAITLLAPLHPTRGMYITVTLRAASALAITWNAVFKANKDVALPTVCVAGKALVAHFRCHDGTNWLLMGLVQEA